MPGFAQLVALVAIAAALACASCTDRRRDDSELDGLVHVERPKPAAIDDDRAASEVAELRRALAVPHHQISEALGAHTVTASSSIEVSKGDQVVESLSDETKIAVDAAGNYRATADNNREYGRHAIYHDGVLYLRPRYGKYHRRAPNDPDEPAEILDQMYSTAAAYFDLLWTGAELSDRGASSSRGVATRKIEISKAPAAADRPPEPLAHRGWRQTITVDAVEGVVVLHRETGAPLSVSISGTIHYLRDGAPYTMKLSARHEIALTQVPPVQPPPGDQTVSAPAVRGEVAERRKLLEGLSSSTGDDDPPPPAKEP